MFSKAKLRRFNEETPCAPPPGAYNPTPLVKSIGPRINRRERFSENNSKISSFSSNESINSSCSDSVGVFKTPRIPRTCRSNVICDLNKLKTTKSEEFLNKKSAYNNCNENSLRCKLKKIEEELEIQKCRNQQLVSQLNNVKHEDYEYLKNENKFLVEEYSKNEILTEFLNEKLETLYLFMNNHIEINMKLSKETHLIETESMSLFVFETQLTNIIEKYEELVSKLEFDLDESIALSNTWKDINDIDKSVINELEIQYEAITEKFQHSEQRFRNLNLIFESQERVISVLKSRLQTSDTACEHLHKVLDDIYRDKSCTTGQFYTDLSEKNAIISNLTSQNNVLELKLQESLDECDLVKSKTEMIQNECRSKIFAFQEILNKYENRFKEWEKTNEYVDSDLNPEKYSETVDKLLKLLTKCREISLNTNCVQENSSDDSFFKKFCSLFGKVFNLEDVHHRKIVHQFFSNIVDEFVTTGQNYAMLENDLNRLRNDLIEKCDECGELTRLLQISEKNVDSEKKCSDYISQCQDIWESEILRQGAEIEKLRFENSNLQEQVQVVRLPLNELENKDAELQKCKFKMEAMEKENSLLLERIALLEKKKCENKSNEKQVKILDANKSIKLKNEKSHSKKALHLVTNSSKTAGKENKTILKPKNTELLKMSTKENIDSTYVITSL